MEVFQELPVKQDLSYFKPFLLLSQIIGAVIVALVILWGEFNGGYADLSDPKTLFNWHPVLMVLGLIIIQGHSILIYRVLRNDDKPRLKVLHAALHFTSFILVSFGLKVVFDSHNLSSPPIPNLYSLHSWIGLGVVICFGLQLVAGLVCFLYPGMRKSLRSRLLPIHVFGGTVLFIMSVCAALMGITEKLVFLGKYSELGSGAIIGNMIGVCIAFFCVVVLFLVTQQRYKRIAPGEEAVLPLEYPDDETHQN